ncbi:MAG: phenylacetate-CoA oxygenase subunit PaaJ [Betaproteobacteria bacterium]|nr:phenylacetate-CoA oxygenase subunit PaaJ [Betaproteobacteria bacterium]
MALRGRGGVRRGVPRDARRRVDAGRERAWRQAGHPYRAPRAHACRDADRRPLASGRPVVSAAAIWKALSAVVDPEIPSVSIVELGIVRSVERSGDQWLVSITPTYSGCPATRVIESDIRDALAQIGGPDIRVVTQLAPPWTTDWIAPEARRKLRETGIAPPQPGGPARAATIDVVRTRRPDDDLVACPRCGSQHTVLVARFGSTACKAQYRCTECLEPFDYFKPY